MNYRLSTDVYNGKGTKASGLVYAKWPLLDHQARYSHPKYLRKSSTLFLTYDFVMFSSVFLIVSHKKTLHDEEFLNLYSKSKQKILWENFYVFVEKNPGIIWIFIPKIDDLICRIKCFKNIFKVVIKTNILF